MPHQFFKGFGMRFFIFLIAFIWGLTGERALADSSLIRDYEIPDPTRPIPEEDRGLGPSGELIPFKPDRLRPSDVVGRRVDEVIPYVGTYGMGGPGFFGIRLGDEWLTIAIWGAGEWIRVDGLLVQDMRFEKYGRPEPWINARGDRLSDALVGSTISKIDVNPRSLQITFSNGRLLVIEEDPGTRPILEGSGEPRRFRNGDDLRDVVFLSPTAEIWI